MQTVVTGDAVQLGTLRPCVMKVVRDYKSEATWMFMNRFIIIVHNLSRQPVAKATLCWYRVRPRETYLRIQTALFTKLKFVKAQFLFISFLKIKKIFKTSYGRRWLSGMGVGKISKPQRKTSFDSNFVDSSYFELKF